ncbi:hypothetical protein I4U23_017046 [Adineta vaga]|nr:hypothetical protein I4U23_017046 [Adineta vaga]
MNSISPINRFIQMNPCHFYRKNNTQNCWLGYKYISCAHLQEYLLKMIKPCTNVVSDNIVVPTITVPQLPSMYSFDNLILSMANNADLDV